MLVDTNVVSSFLREGAAHRSPKLAAFMEQLLAAGNLTISAVTEFELRRGVEELVSKGQGRKRLVMLTKFLEHCEILSLDGGGWELAAKLWAKGRTHKPAIVFTDADLLIAATAFFHERTFATSEANLVTNLALIGVTDVTLVSND
jgi:predicted nucleic acid-binding protein